MVLVIVLLDQFVWRPVIAWAEKFKVEQVESTDAPRSWVLNLVATFERARENSAENSAAAGGTSALVFCAEAWGRTSRKSTSAWRDWLLRGLAVLTLGGIGYGVVRVAIILSGVGKAELHATALGLGATFLRVNLALLIGALWTIPAGVAIGFNPRLARIAQPLAQIAASVPATALLPVILLVLIRLGGGLGLASIVVLLLGTQWYVLFNVIAGAMAIPTDLKECCSVFRVRGHRSAGRS